MIFVDTSFWVALRNQRDAHHEQAVRLMTECQADALITTNLVRGETWTYLRRRAGHRSSVGFVDSVERSPRVRVVVVSDAAESEAWRWLRMRDEREYSFVDATSFAVMRQLKVRDALAFDGDFAAAGFLERRPGPPS